MEFQKLNHFIIKHSDSGNKKIEKTIGQNIYNIQELINGIKSSKNKNNKLYKVTKSISSIIDLYDDSNKIKLDRTSFLKEYYKELETVFHKKDIQEYKEIMDLIIDDTVQYDNANWDLIYETIKNSLSEEHQIIDKNALYDLDFERLVPKSLVSLLKDEKNDMIKGGFFSFQSYTQEMLGVINEYVLLKDVKMTRFFLEKGKNEEIKIVELLKEVNAASVVEPFSFSNGEPYFQKAANGQLDGFIIHQNKAKVLLATKDENTNIEGDSVFRHFITGLLIKKKIDEVKAKDHLIKKKTQYWINHYTNDKNISTQIAKLKENRRIYKRKKNLAITSNDYYVDNEFVLKLNQTINDAEHRGLKEISMQLRFDNSPVYMLDRELIKKEFKLPQKGSKTGLIKMDIESAKEKLRLVSKIAQLQKIDKDELVDLGFNKVVGNPRFLEQIEIDVKKAQIADEEEFLSIREMISYYNRNTKKALEELGIIEKNLNIGTPLEIYNKNKEQSPIPEIANEEMDKILSLASKHQVDLIYYGSVSGKKQAEEFHYDKDEKIKNKEFRYGLNALAYANILSDSVKDRFRISTDAALDFVNKMELRTVTKKTKNGFDLDIEKINKKDFTQNVVKTIFKDIYEENGVKNDSVDFYENLFNSTNAILADIIEDFEFAKDHAKENNLELNYKKIFNKTLQNRTNSKKDYDIVKIFDTIKDISISKTEKFIHGNSIIEAVNNKVDKIIKDSGDAELKGIYDKYNHNRSKNVKERKRRVGRLFN